MSPTSHPPLIRIPKPEQSNLNTDRPSYPGGTENNSSFKHNPYQQNRFSRLLRPCPNARCLPTSKASAESFQAWLNAAYALGTHFHLDCDIPTHVDLHARGVIEHRVTVTCCKCGSHLNKHSELYRLICSRGHKQCGACSVTSTQAGIWRRHSRLPGRGAGCNIPDRYQRLWVTLAWDRCMHA